MSLLGVSSSVDDAGVGVVKLNTSAQRFRQGVLVGVGKIVSTALPFFDSNFDIRYKHYRNSLMAIS